MNIFSKNPERCSYILDLLVNKGAQVNKKNFDNWAPIHTAVRKGQESAIKAIGRFEPQEHARKAPQQQFDLDLGGGSQQWTALHLAALSSQPKILVDLAQAGANIFQRNLQNQLPRHCARGNFITTKIIKQIEQRQLRNSF